MDANDPCANRTHLVLVESRSFAPLSVAVLVLLYCTVGIASLIGNLSVLVVLCIHRELRTVTNVFIGSVSLADILVTVVSLWPSPLYYVLRHWPFGSFLCHTVYVLQGASLMWMPLTLAAIAFDRYRQIASAYKGRQMSMGACILWIVAIWSTSLLLLLPVLNHLQYIEFEDRCTHHVNKFCNENWYGEEKRRSIYGIFVLVVRSLAPLVVISLCHWRIASIYTRQASKLHRTRSMTSQATAMDLRRKQRLQTLLLSMVVVFAVSSLPLDIFNLLQDMQIIGGMDSLSEQQLMHVASFTCHWLAMAGTLLNPLVYAWYNENLRVPIKALLTCRSTPPPSAKHSTAGFHTAACQHTSLTMALSSTTPSETNRSSGSRKERSQLIRLLSIGSDDTNSQERVIIAQQKQQTGSRHDDTSPCHGRLAAAQCPPTSLTISLRATDDPLDVDDDTQL